MFYNVLPAAIASGTAVGGPMCGLHTRVAINSDSYSRDQRRPYMHPEIALTFRRTSQHLVERSPRPNSPTMWPAFASSLISTAAVKSGASRSNHGKGTRAEAKSTSEIVKKSNG